MHLARFKTPSGGYDPGAFDREATELLTMMRPGTIIRLHVGSMLPCVEFPPPFGPQHRVVVVSFEPYVLEVWSNLLGTDGGDPDGDAAA